MKRTLSVLGLAMAVLSLASTEARAQLPTAPPPPPQVDEAPAPPTTIMFGYSYLHDFSWKEHLFKGYMFEMAHRIGTNLAIVGEIGGSHGEYGDTGFTIQRYALLGGVRIYGGEGRLRPFFHVLAGAERQGGDVGIANGWAVQPGGGVDFAWTDRLTLRGQGDFREIFEDGQNYHSYRFSGGLVLAIGKPKK